MKHLRSLALASTFGLGLATSPALADALSTPSMSASLSANSSPFSVDLPDWFGDAGGKIFVGGALSGMAYVQSNATHLTPGDADSFLDLTNGQIFVQKTDGWLQFFVDAGAYSFPTVGYPYLDTANTMGGPFSSIFPFGFVPVAYAKIVGSGPLSGFSIEGGKLPTLIGDEYGFTYQNLNIERGLLWFNEPIISRGVQVNYSAGPLTVSLSLNDGTYSDTYNVLSGLVSYGFNGGADTLAFAASGNLGKGNFSALNSGSVYNLILTHTMGSLTISPYIQFNSTPSLGAAHGSNVWAGALLVNYALDDNWKVGLRGEYESESGNSGVFDRPDILGYGPGTSAWSITLTPTYQYKIFYARVEGSYVGLDGATFGFGRGFTSDSQFRGLAEIGILF